MHVALSAARTIVCSAPIVQRKDVSTDEEKATAALEGMSISAKVTPRRPAKKRSGRAKAVESRKRVDAKSAHRSKDEWLIPNSRPQQDRSLNALFIRANLLGNDNNIHARGWIQETNSWRRFSGKYSQAACSERTHS